MPIAQIQRAIFHRRTILVALSLFVTGVFLTFFHGWLQRNSLRMWMFEDGYRVQTTQGNSTFWYTSHKPFPPGQYHVTVNYAIESNMADPGNWVRFDVLSFNEQNLYFSEQKPLLEKLRGYYVETFTVNIPENIENFQVRTTTDYPTFGITGVYVEQDPAVSWPWELMNWNLMGAAAVILTISLFYAQLLARFSPKYIVISLCAITLACSLWWPKPAHLSGDEPHYLVTMKNLLVNKTLDMSNAYVPDITREFSAEELTPHTHVSELNGGVYSHHGYFTAILLIPGYLIGKVAGVQFEMGMFAALCVILTFLVAKSFRIPTWLSVVSAIGLLLTPFVYYTFEIYPEVIAASFFLIGIYAAGQKSLQLKYFAMGLVGLSLLLNGKYVGLASGVGMLLFVSHLRTFDSWKKALRSATTWTCVAIAALTVSLSFLLNWQMYGGFGLFTYYSGGARIREEEVSWNKLEDMSVTAMAHIVDSRAGLVVWVPSVVFIVFGLLRLMAEKDPHQRDAGVWLTIAITMYYAIYSFSGSLGGESAALRPWIAAFPILAILIAKGLQSVKFQAVAAMLFLPTVYFTLGSTYFGQTVTNVYSYWVNPFLFATGKGQFNNLGMYLPMLTDRRSFNLHDFLGMILIVFLQITILLGSLRWKDISAHCKKIIHWRGSAP